MRRTGSLDATAIRKYWAKGGIEVKQVNRVASGYALVTDRKTSKAIMAQKEHYETAFRCKLEKAQTWYFYVLNNTPTKTAEFSERGQEWTETSEADLLEEARRLTGVMPQRAMWGKTPADGDGRRSAVVVFDKPIKERFRLFGESKPARLVPQRNGKGKAAE